MAAELLDGGENSGDKKQIGRAFHPIPEIASLTSIDPVDCERDQLVFSHRWPISGVGELYVGLNPLYTNAYDVFQKEPVIPVEPIVFEESAADDEFTCALLVGATTLVTSEYDIIPEGERTLKFKGWYDSADGEPVKEVALGNPGAIVDMRVALNRVKIVSPL